MPRKTTRAIDSDDSSISQKPPRSEKQKGPELKSEKEQTSRKETSGTRPKLTDASFVLKGVTGTASRVVQQAASILEEEIAAGIVAAKKAELQFINVNEVRSGEPEEVLNRFRRDSHEVVDILLDVFSAATKRAGSLTQRMISIQGTKPQEEVKSAASEQLPKLMVPQPIKAGESAEVPMTLENNGDEATEEFSFNSTDLVNASGDRILAAKITFSPSSLTIAPKKSTKVAVTIKVPQKTPHGVYSGLVQASKLSRLRAILVAEVG